MVEIVQKLLMMDCILAAAVLVLAFVAAYLYRAVRRLNQALLAQYRVLCYLHPELMESAEGVSDGR